MQGDRQIKFRKVLSKLKKSEDGKLFLDIVIGASGYFDEPGEKESNDHYLGRRAVGKLIVDNLN